MRGHLRTKTLSRIVPGRCLMRELPRFLPPAEETVHPSDDRFVFFAQSSLSGGAATLNRSINQAFTFTLESGALWEPASLQFVEISPPSIPSTQRPALHRRHLPSLVHNPRDEMRYSTICRYERLVRPEVTLRQLPPKRHRKGPQPRSRPAMTSLLVLLRLANITRGN